MKKILLTLFLLSIDALKAQPTITQYQEKCAAIEVGAHANTNMGSPEYYRRILKTTHDNCVDAFPGCCKSERISLSQVFGIAGSGVVVGASLGILATVYILRKRS
jgi:ABC-type dipeptide/oligopeptide/nickel transport system permease subunit